MDWRSRVQERGDFRCEVTDGLEESARKRVFSMSEVTDGRQWGR
jgi:hypothetical protein